MRLALFVVWLALVAGAAWAVMFMVPEGDGFTRGLNRFVILLVTGFGALVVAIALALATRRLPQPRDRGAAMMGFFPLLFTGGFWVVFAIVVALAVFTFQLGPGDDMSSAPPPATTPVQP